MFAKILPWKMDEDEPSAAAAISLARNKGQAAAMMEHEWTALSPLNGLVLPANAEVAERVLHDTLLSRARDVLGIETVDPPFFIPH